ncbi:MAG: UDP-N-acetylmuramate dehydrogenase [Phycisphaerae bacterium]
MSCFEHFAEILRTNAPLAPLTWYQLGGPARYYAEPRDESELAALLRCARDSGVAWRILGRGANLLVRDEGFDGLVVRLCGPCFEEVEYDGQRVQVGAGRDFTRLVRESLDLGLTGLEALAGIPGTVGGIIRMNAGGRYGEIASFVERMSLIDAQGELVERDAAGIGFSYRHTCLDGCAILGARLLLQQADATHAKARYREIWNEKYSNQPPVSARTCGCIFKNPPGHSAGVLIDRAGLKGHRVGGAVISAKHANFIVAEADARARDVLDLIALAKDRVWNQTGFELQLEVEVW